MDISLIGNYEEDKLHDKRLKEFDYSTIRFSEQEIRKDLRNVITVFGKVLA